MLEKHLEKRNLCVVLDCQLTPLKSDCHIGTDLPELTTIL
jgi:hypothetical protein